MLRTLTFKWNCLIWSYDKYSHETIRRHRRFCDYENAAKYIKLNYIVVSQSENEQPSD